VKNLAEQQRHEIEVQFGRQRAVTDLRSAAQYRLGSWGSCIRGIIFRDMPSTSLKTLDMAVDRVDFNTAFISHQIAQRRDEAAETDEWLMPVRETSPETFMAAAIRYVLTYPPDDQVKQFQHVTGLSRPTYYRAIDRVVQHVGAEILLKENPELRHRQELRFMKIVNGE